MGTYLSIPYVSRKVVHLEPVKPIVLDLENTVTVIEAEERSLTPIVEEVKEEAKEEPVVELKEEKVEPKVEVKEIVDFPPVNLKIIIPVETTHDVVPESPKQSVARIPEFVPNTTSESHAVKKYNRRHRKRND